MEILNDCFRILTLQRVLHGENVFASRFSRFYPAALREKHAYQNKSTLLEDILEPHSSTSASTNLPSDNPIDCENDERDPLIPSDRKNEQKLGNEFSVIASRNPK